MWWENALKCWPFCPSWKTLPQNRVLSSWQTFSEYQVREYMRGHTYCLLEQLVVCTCGGVGVPYLVQPKLQQALCPVYIFVPPQCLPGPGKHLWNDSDGQFVAPKLCRLCEQHFVPRSHRLLSLPTIISRVEKSNFIFSCLVATPWAGLTHTPGFFSEIFLVYVALDQDFFSPSALFSC